MSEHAVLFSIRTSTNGSLRSVSPRCRLFSNSLDTRKRPQRWLDLESLMIPFLAPFSFYFPGMLVGPYVVYSDYQALIDETMFKVEGVEGKTKQGMAIPIGRKRVAYRRLIMGLLYLAVYVVRPRICRFWNSTLNALLFPDVHHEVQLFTQPRPLVLSAKFRKAVSCYLMLNSQYCADHLHAE